jgi:hypothetical protein
MPRSSDDVIRQLLRKFFFQPAHGTNHDAYALIIDGRRIATIRFSRGRRRNLDDRMLRIMARELRAPDLAYFKGMLDCTISNGNYLAHLRESGYLSE